MSTKIMTQVWANGPAQPHLRLLLLALADNANDHGVCWPSVETLAHKCAVRPRAVQRSLRELEAAGWITSDQRLGRSTYYTLRGVVDDRGVVSDRGVVDDTTGGVVDDRGRGVVDDRGGRRGRHPEPSRTTTENHQLNRPRHSTPF